MTTVPRRQHVPGGTRWSPTWLVLRSTTLLLAAGVVAAGLAALSGCSPAGPGSASGQPSLPPSPFEAFEASVDGGLSWQEFAEVLHEKSEEATAACMKDKGWVYHPLSADAVTVGHGTSPHDLTIEEASTLGYGITAEATTTSPADSDDPNADYLGSLSPDEVELYLRDLTGQGTSDGDDNSAAVPGCLAKGITSNPAHTFRADPRWAAIETEMAAVTDAARREPEARAADADWSTCMVEAGYPGFSSPDDASSTIWAEADALTGGSDYASAEKLTAFHEDREIPVAVQDATCRVEVDHSARHLDVIARAEQAYLDAHAVDLEEYALAYAAMLATL